MIISHMLKKLFKSEITLMDEAEYDQILMNTINLLKWNFFELDVDIYMETNQVVAACIWSYILGYNTSAIGWLYYNSLEMIVVRSEEMYD